MRALVQRVLRASVLVDEELHSEIGGGLLVLLGVKAGDRDWEAHRIADKIANVRLFADGAGQMNRSILETGGEILLVSQFTLYGDTRKGRRPSFDDAAKPDVAEPLVEAVAERLRHFGISVEEGVFGAHMHVELSNDGPVTILIET